MARKSRRAYPAAFPQELVQLVRGGRSPEELSREFEPSAQTIRNWAAQADRDDGRRSDGLTTDEWLELHQLRREKAGPREEREILKSRGLVRTGDRDDPARVFAFMKAHQAGHG